MKSYNLILVTVAFAIAAAGAIGGQQNSDALTIIYGKDISTNQCLQGDPSTMQPGCSTAAASFPCTIIIYATGLQGRAYNSKIGTTCVQPFWYN
ncbi:hypothetical protein [Dawidia soli]|uniref:Secreted protein n=1 Tax=Dawidia soli TaxID=2782352 RepID=A0AAP2DFQ7_9BACT|nr:hypothetical protein [Dawidia soli]MBT1689860.1 hypothetical protein [Dawidia soli]